MDNPTNLTTEILAKIDEVSVYHSGRNSVEMNRKLESGDWILIGVATGQDETGYPITQYSLGRFRL
ncbi:TPA: hypothetical protein LSH76_001297 [Morganella morganii]|nr:hypothetical protein [Morganella morganii]